MGLQSFVNLSTPEVSPNIHYYYHSYDPFGRGYHFHTGRDLDQSNWVKGALGSRYNPTIFLDENRYFDRQRFLGFVWSNRFEIGGEISEKQKRVFHLGLNGLLKLRWGLIRIKLYLKDSDGVIIGRMGYDEKQRLVPQFHPGLELEPLYCPANLQ